MKIYVKIFKATFRNAPPPFLINNKIMKKYLIIFNKKKTLISFITIIYNNI